MKHSKTISAAFLALAVLGLSACDRPTVVTTPPSTAVVPVPVPVPGPPGPAGPAGDPGAPGAKGSPGGDTVVIMPPAAPASQ